MKKITYYLFSFVIVPLLIFHNAGAQNVGINTTSATPNSSAILDMSTGTTGGNLGLLIPHVGLKYDSLATPVTTPATGLVVYDTVSNVSVSTGNWSAGVYPGHYYYSGSHWVFMGTKLDVPYYMQTWTGVSSGSSGDVKNWLFPKYYCAVEVFNYTYGNTNLKAVDYRSNQNSAYGSGAYGFPAGWTEASPANALSLNGWWSSNFTASSYTLVNKFVGMVSIDSSNNNSNVGSFTIKILLMKYSFTSGSSAIPTGVAIDSNSVVCSTVKNPYRITVNGNGTVLHPGDIIIIWSQITSGGKFHEFFNIQGNLEMTTE
jgi:hypothetical protein